MEYLTLAAYIYGFLGVVFALFLVWSDEYLKPGWDLLIIIPGMILLWPYLSYKCVKL